MFFHDDACGEDGHWISTRRVFLFPLKALSTVFRGKFLAALKRAFDAGAIALAGTTAALTDARTRARLFSDLYAREWMVAGPQQVLAYLGGLHPPHRAHQQPSGEFR
jgi:Putative transposase